MILVRLILFMTMTLCLFLFSCTITRLTSNRIDKNPPYKIKNITAGKRGDYYPEFSPDGKQIVFSSKRGDYANLWIMDADGSNMRQLTGGDAVDVSPVFTPDGRMVIFSSNRGKDRAGHNIWSVNVDGTGLTQITKEETYDGSPRPALDGSKIVFVSQREGDYSIWMMDIDGNMPRRLSSGGNGDWFPAMNSNGKEIVFVSTRLGHGDIWTIDIEGKVYKRLTFSNEPEFSPSWSPDGEKIAYVTRREGLFDIWVMSRDGSRKMRLTRGISGWNKRHKFSRSAIVNTAGYYHISWHPDGTKIAFTAWNKRGGSRISILEFDKKTFDKLSSDDSLSVPDEYTLIGEKRLTDGNWEDFAPHFSPDAKNLAFSSDRSGNWDIWMMDLNDTNIRQLTDNAGDDILPVFSPDGKEIAFLSDRDDDKYSVWIITPDGGEANRVTRDISVLSCPAWHPNGKEIVFIAKAQNNAQLWIYNIEDGISEMVTGMDSLEDIEKDAFPFKNFFYRIDYDKTGNRIIFESDRAGNVDIWTVKRDGTGLRRIIRGKNSPHWNPVFSPDGSKISYTTTKIDEEAGGYQGPNFNIWIADIETGAEMMLTGEEQADWNPSWSPDGKRIAYVTNRSDDFKHFKIWMLYLQ